MVYRARCWPSIRRNIRSCAGQQWRRNFDLSQSSRNLERKPPPFYNRKFILLSRVRNRKWWWRRNRMCVQPGSQSEFEADQGPPLPFASFIRLFPSVRGFPDNSCCPAFPAPTLYKVREMDYWKLIESNTEYFLDFSCSKPSTSSANAHAKKRGGSKEPKNSQNKNASLIQAQAQSNHRSHQPATLDTIFFGPTTSGVSLLCL